MKKWWKSRSNAYALTMIPMLNYALTNVNQLGLSPIAATWVGIALTGLTVAGAMYMRLITNKGIG